MPAGPPDTTPITRESYARILPLDEFERLRAGDGLGTIVCTSGGFDPIHPGHVTCIVESKQFGDTLVVVVNGDGFLTAKKGRPFQDVHTRCWIVAGLRGVDYVVPFESKDDPTVCEPLRRIRPHVFTKGGDRIDMTSIPEWRVCQDLGIRVETAVGLRKDWSSSDFLREWGDFWAERKQR